MANISILNLNPSGSDLFSDHESYMTELADRELEHVNGGFWVSTMICFSLTRSLVIN
jgi:hypothetical protein